MAKIETFLDFEAALAGLANRVWTGAAEDAIPALVTAVQKGDAFEVDNLVQNLTITSEVEKLLPRAELIMQAAMLFGAEFATGIPVTKTDMYKSGQDPLVASAAVAFKGIVTTALYNIVHRQASKVLGDLIQAQHEEAQAIKKADKALEDAVRELVLGNGRMMVDIGANLTTSRLVNYGALFEMHAHGYKTYQLNATLDERTSQVCRRMHGKTFIVETALASAQKALLTTDPAELKTAAPWIRSNKETLKHLETASSKDLQAQGYAVPPFHPRCRTVVVMTGEVTTTGLEFTPVKIIEEIIDPVSVTPVAFSTENPVSIDSYQEHTAFLKASTKQLPLDDATREALAAYQSYGYANINGFLRQGGALSDKIKAQVAMIDKAMAGATVTQPVKVYRSAANLFEAIGIDPNDAGAIGKTFMDRGYTSTSTSRKFAQNWYYEQAEQLTNDGIYDADKVFVEIVIPKNSQALSLSNLGQDTGDLEQEFLLPRNTVFRIVSIKKTGTRYDVVLEVDQPKTPDLSLFTKAAAPVRKANKYTWLPGDLVAF